MNLKEDRKGGIKEEEMREIQNKNSHLSPTRLATTGDASTLNSPIKGNCQAGTLKGHSTTHYLQKIRFKHQDPER